MTWILILYLPFLLGFFATIRNRQEIVTPVSLLVLFNVVALLGTTMITDPDVATDRKYAWLVWSLTCLLTVCVTIFRMRKLSPRRSELALRASITPMTASIWGLLAFSLLVSLVYYLAVGHITLLSSLSSGSEFDSATARLNSYAGGTYFFPGYVNQFKNSILPALTFAVCHSAWKQKMLYRLPLAIVLGSITFVLVAGTGQRAPMVIVFLVLVLSSWIGGLLRGSRLVAIGAVGFGAFALLTLVLQRQAAQLANAGSLTDEVGVFASALWSRVVYENPYSGLYAFYYTESLPFAWGSEWLTDIAGVLPGASGSDLANRVFAMLYGSPRGTAPASLWGGMYYNFGIMGSIGVTIVIAVIYVRLSSALVNSIARDEEPNFLRLISLSGMAVSAGAWVAGSPLTVLNQGFFAYLFLFWLSGKLKVGGLGRTSQDREGYANCYAVVRSEEGTKR